MNFLTHPQAMQSSGKHKGLRIESYFSGRTDTMQGAVP